MESRALMCHQGRTTRQMTASQEQEAAKMQTTAILPEQSLSLVEIFLHAAIASVLYSRGLLTHDHKVFADRCVADLLGATGLVTYKEFLDLKNTQAKQMKSQVFKVLVNRYYSTGAQRILFLLENGVFSALRNGYLEAIQLSICADSTRPSEVLECYTFSFTYSSPSGQGSRTISSITVSPVHQAVFFVGDAQRSFNAAIKSLLKLIHGLPQLPRKRNLALNLIYTDDCPASYEPHGFTSCNDNELAFPGGTDLVRQSKKTSSLITGAYRVGVVVSHVDSAEGEEQLKVIPEDMQYSNKRTRLNEYKLALNEGPALSADPPVQRFAQLVPSTALPDGSVTESPGALSTQTREDIQTRTALQQMQQSSANDSRIVPTQTLFDDDDDVHSEDSNPPDQSYSNALVNATQLQDGHERMIVPDKMAELIIHVRAFQNRSPVGQRVFDDKALNGYRIKRHMPSNLVKCECMDQSAGEGTTICCEVCGTWQHLSCYGWDGVQKCNRPVYHVCYGCLLLPEEKELNDWMPTLVACRNALKYLYDNGFDPNDDKALIQAMRHNGDPADLMSSKVMQILIKEQLIQVGEGGSRAIVQANRRKGIVDFIDPMASIFHHYIVRDRPEIPLGNRYKGAVETQVLAYKGYALDTIVTQDSFGEDVVRYGWYPRLAALQARRKRPASAMEGDMDAAAGGKKMSMAGLGLNDGN